MVLLGIEEKPCGGVDSFLRGQQVDDIARKHPGMGAGSMIDFIDSAQTDRRDAVFAAQSGFPKSLVAG